MIIIFESTGGGQWFVGEEVSSREPKILKVSYSCEDAVEKAEVVVKGKKGIKKIILNGTVSRECRVRVRDFNKLIAHTE